MKKYLSVLAVLCLIAVLVSSVSASLSPATLGPITLKPGEYVDEEKTVFLPGTIPKGDVVFAFDLTGSMGDDTAVVKAQAVSLMTTIAGLITDVQFGVMSFMDYPHTYTSFGYSATYGDASFGDYAYRLDQPMTSNTATVSTKINGLVLGYGADGPQDYTRIMFESYSDSGVGWRPGAKKIIVMLGDAVPHDNDINAGVPGKVGTYSTGGDPGRDEVILNADDLDLQTVLTAMNTNNVVLLYIQCANPMLGSETIDYWNHWTGLTGGAAFSISNAADVPAAIQNLISAEAAHVDVLTLKAETGYEAWLTSVVPPSYTDITIPPEGTSKVFNIRITVPLGTPIGTYVFHIIADADGASYGEQLVTIVVPLEQVIPETPLGTIAAASSICMAFLAFVGIPKLRLRRKSASL